jgi:hypothetical protein
MGGKWDFNQLVDDNKPLKQYGVGLKVVGFLEVDISVLNVPTLMGF